MPLVAKLLVVLAILPHARFLLHHLASARRVDNGFLVLIGSGPDEAMSAMSSEVLYTISLGAALLLAFLYPDPEVARAFAWFWLVTFAVGAALGALTTMDEVRLHAVIVGALGVALLHPKFVIAEAFAFFGFACVVVSGLYCAMRGMRRPGLFYYSVPAGLALLTVAAAAGQL